MRIREQLGTSLKVPFAFLVGFLSLQICAWDVLATSVSVKRWGVQIEPKGEADLKAVPDQPKEGIQKSGAIGPSELLGEIVNECGVLAGSLGSAGQVTEKDAAKLTSLRIYQLEEIFTSEQSYVESLESFLEEKIDIRKNGKPPKTLFDEFFDKGLFKKSERNLVHKAVKSLTELIHKGRHRIDQMKDDFSMTKDPGSIVRMEKSILNHLDPVEIGKDVSDYTIHYLEFSKILQRIENSSKGEKILRRRINAIKEKIALGLLKGDHRRTLTPAAFAIAPIQRIMRYPLLLKAIVGQSETDKKTGHVTGNGQRLNNEYFDELFDLYLRFKTEVVGINELQETMETYNIRNTSCFR